MQVRRCPHLEALNFINRGQKREGEASLWSSRHCGQARKVKVRAWEFSNVPGCEAQSQGPYLTLPAVPTRRSRRGSAPRPQGQMARAGGAVPTEPSANAGKPACPSHLQGSPPTPHKHPASQGPRLGLT